MLHDGSVILINPTVSHPEEIWGQRFQLAVWSTYLNTRKLLLIYIVLHTFSHFILAEHVIFNRTKVS